MRRRGERRSCRASVAARLQHGVLAVAGVRVPCSDGHAVEGFDFTAAVRGICADMAARLPELRTSTSVASPSALRTARHRQPARRVCHAHAAAVRRRRAGTDPSRPPLAHRAAWPTTTGREFLYLLSFYLPRFLDLPLEEKLSTIVHELWHIGPRFDGDLRRHEGRCYAHGRSQREYDAAMDRLAQRWLAADPPQHLYEFLGRTSTNCGRARRSSWRPLADAAAGTGVSRR